MEVVLDVYKRPYDPLHPVICMDESPRQLIAETRLPIPASSGTLSKYDYEYRRCGTCNIFLAGEPLAGKRMVKITERRTKQDWAYLLEDIAEKYAQAEKITLVMDNLNTWKGSSHRLLKKLNTSVTLFVNLSSSHRTLFQVFHISILMGLISS